MPQPVDFPMEVARMTAAQRVQELADRSAMATQQRLAHDQQETRLAAETQVQETPQAENPAVDGDGRRQNPFAGRRHRRGSQASGGHEENGEPPRHYHLPEDGEDNPDAFDGQGIRLDVTI